jgi:dihydrofolate reductase
VPRPFHLIVSCAENGVIGRDRKLPWKIPEDHRYFHGQTAGQVVVMGRICFETWPGATADGRKSVLVSNHPWNDPRRMPTKSAASLPAALAAAAQLPGEIYICGGERIYREAIEHPDADLLYLTLVHASVAGDTFFPDWRTRFTRQISRRESSDANYRYTFLTLARPLDPRHGGVLGL